MWKRHKLSLQTDNSIEEIITITVITVITAATNKDYVALYVIRKNVAYRNILRRNKKSLKLSLGLLTETSLANLITNLTNNLINILWTIKTIILT